MNGEVWSLLTIGGPILLGLVLLWALLRNRNAPGRAETEAATKELYRAQDAQDKAEDDKVQR